LRFFQFIVVLFSVPVFADEIHFEWNMNVSALHDHWIANDQKAVTVFLSSGSVSYLTASSTFLENISIGQPIFLGYRTEESQQGHYRFQDFEYVLLSNIKNLTNHLPVIVAERSPVNHAKDWKKGMESETTYLSLESHDPTLELVRLVAIEQVEDIQINLVDSQSSVDFERLVEVLKLLRSSSKRVKVHFLSRVGLTLEESSLKKFLLVYENLGNTFPGVEFTLTVEGNGLKRVNVNEPAVIKWRTKNSEVEITSQMLDKFTNSMLAAEQRCFIRLEVDRHATDHRVLDFVHVIGGYEWLPITDFVTEKFARWITTKQVKGEIPKFDPQKLRDLTSDLEKLREIINQSQVERFAKFSVWKLNWLKRTHGVR